MNFSSDNILVYDIGGTKLRGAIYSPRTKTITAQVVKPTPNRILCPTLSAEELYKETLNSIRTVSNELLKHESVSAVTVAFPGPVDRQGRVIAAPGIWGRNPSGPIDMLADLQTIWPQMRVHIVNDLTAAGYRYLESKTESFCILTVSTGIGSKIFIKGEPQLGADGTGGEIGHAKVLLAENAPLCDCGEPGHLQAISSGRGVLQTIRALAQIDSPAFKASKLGQNRTSLAEISNHLIVEAFRASDPFTVQIIHASLIPLALVLLNLYLALGLDRFIIIGGFALALGEPYRLALVKLIGDYCWESQVRWDEMIQLGIDDDQSGLIGGAKLAADSDYICRHKKK